MDVAIIGKGTSSIITALVLLRRGHNVIIFYDPKVPPINVGESTTPHIQELINSTLGISIHDLVDRGIFSYKMGINFVNWGKGKSFNHNFADGGIGHHFETKLFNDFIHEYFEKNNLVTYFPEKVISIDTTINNSVSINGKNFDFLINCSGWEDSKNYLIPFFKTVDSAITFVEELDTNKYDSTHTLHLATEDGWQFGLPFPKQNIIKCGYLYSRDYVTEKQVKNKLNKNIRSSFSWTPRYAKEILVHSNIALNGNRLFFIEPLQALSLAYTKLFAEFISDYLDNKCIEFFDDINYRYSLEMWAYQLSLAYHYQYGSIYKTKFWQNIKSNAIDVMKASFNGNPEVFQMNLERDYRNKNKKYSNIGSFGFADLQQIHFNMLGVDNPFKKF